MILMLSSREDHKQGRFMQLKIIFILLLQFCFTTYAQIAPKSPEAVVLDELEAIHGFNTQRVLSVYGGKKSEVLNFLREVFLNTDIYFSKLNKQSQPFIKNVILANYCHFVPISSGLSSLDKDFLQDALDDANANDNDDQKLSIYACFRNLGSKDGLDRLLAHFNHEPQDYMKGQILDLAIGLLNNSKQAKKPVGDMVYNQQVEFNLVDNFYEREQTDWRSSLLQLQKISKWHEKKMNHLYPNQKAIIDSYKKFNTKITLALNQIQNNKAQVKLNPDNSSDNNKKIGRKPQSIDEKNNELQRDISSIEGSNSSFTNILAIMLLLISILSVLFYFIKKKKH